MIILEGADNSGKSTLAERLAKDLTCLYNEKVKVMHSPGPMDRRSEMVTWLLEEITNAPKPLIYDRVSVISDVVYAPIVRGEPSFYVTSKVKHHVDELIRMLPHIIIYCRPTKRNILEENGRDQMEGVYENFIEIIDSYDSYIKKYIEAGFNVMTYSYELGEEHYQKLLEEVMSVYHQGKIQERIKSKEFREWR